MSRRKQSKPQHVEFPDNKNSLIVSDEGGRTTSSVATTEKVVSENENTNDEVEATQGEEENIHARDVDNEPNYKATTDCNELTDESASDNPVHMAVHRASLAGFDVNSEFSPESLASAHGQFVSAHRSLLYSKYNAALDGHNQASWNGNQDTSENEGRNQMDAILYYTYSSTVNQSHVLRE